MTRWYIVRDGRFDSPPYYQATKIAGLVRKAGGKNVRLSNYHGWSNQPKVVCFEAPTEAAAEMVAAWVADGLGKKFRNGVWAAKKFW